MNVRDLIVTMAATNEVAGHDKVAWTDADLKTIISEVFPEYEEDID